MKNYCRFLIACLVVIGMFCMLVTANTEIYSNKTIFFDDFTFELSNGEADLFVNHTGSGSLKTRDTDRGYYVLSKDSTTDKTTVDPTFKTPSFNATAEKTVLEFSVSHTGAQNYSVHVYSEDDILLTLVDKETSRDWIDYKAIFDFASNNVSLYIDGVYSGDYVLSSDNDLIGQEIQFQFVGYHIRSLTAEVLFDYINIYKYDSNIVCVNNSNNTDVNKIEAQFFAPLTSDLTVGNNLTVDGAEIKSVTRKSGSLNSYEIEFVNKLDFKTDYELVLNNNCIAGGADGEVSGTFTTRAREFKVATPVVSSNVLTNGNCNISVDVDNETLTEESVLLNVTLYDGEKMVWTKFVPDLITGAKTVTTTAELSGITDNSVLKVIVFDKIDKLYPLSPMTTLTTSGKVVEDIYAGERTGSSTAAYTFDPDNLMVTVNINISEESKGTFFAGAMIDGNTAITDINLANPVGITYFTYGIFNEAVNNISYIIPDRSNSYKFIWVTGDDSKLNSIDMDIYSTTYLNDALDVINGASTPSDLWGHLKTYGSAFQMTVSESYDETLYLSMLALKGESFSSPSELKSAFVTANKLVYKNSSNIDALITEINQNIPLLTLSLYNNTLSESAVQYVKDKLIETAILTDKEFSQKFNYYVIAGGIYHAENYTQVQNIIENTTASTLIDLDKYNASEANIKKSAALALMGNLYDDYTSLKSAFNSYFNSTNKPVVRPSGGGGGGGSIGGSTGSVNKNVYDTPVSYPVVEKEPDGIAFTDMSDYEWAAEAVEHLVSIGAVAGKNRNEFCPEDFITREEAAKIIAIAFELKANSESSEKFNDVSNGDWSCEYIEAVSSNGVMNGIDKQNFGKDTLLSRQMLATILYRLAVSTETELEDKTLEFADMSEVDEYAVDAIGILYGNGLINGVGENRFSPNQNCTRAEAAKMISDFVKFCEPKEE